MNVQVLIEAIVRQVTVLIAQLATTGGLRAPLAQVANQVFVELSRELEAQGVSRKVSADMFGMALRAYVRKVRRLTASATDDETTLWQAVFDFIRKAELVPRDRILGRFQFDGELEVSSILKDLTDSGLVFCSGSGPSAIYRAATDREFGALSSITRDEGLSELAWVIIFRDGPLTISALSDKLSRTTPQTEALIEPLVLDGRIERIDDSLSATEFLIPLGSALGWEASILDHVQAMVQTICARLEEASRRADPSGTVGGSTYTFDVWPGHPLYEEVTEQLSRERARFGELRKRVEEINRGSGKPPNFEEVVIYFGQCVRDRELLKGSSDETA